MTTVDHDYVIDGRPVSVRIDNAAEATWGDDVVLSSPRTDPTAAQPWYERGFDVVDLFTDEEFASLHDDVEATVRGILEGWGRDTTDFTLERYHHHVDDDTHAQVVGRTRDLFQHDLHLEVATMHERLGDVLGLRLTDTVPDPPMTLHVIVRLIRPGSTDFNPAHKDVYEAVDHLGIVPPLVNFWIPVAGCGPHSSLPLAPGSHLIPESQILRTRAGSVVHGRRYRVNSILQWAGSRSLQRADVADGQALVFSSHLIHGLAVNTQPDTTRVALEFRLIPA